MTAPGNSPDPSSFLMGGGGGKSARFATPGDEVAGTLLDEGRVVQQTEYVRGGGVGKPLFWDNGDPKMQLVVRIQTELREDADDDGVRALYIKGGFKSPTIQKAVADAVRQAGAKGLATGGHLTIRFTGTDPADTSAQAQKYYIAKYEAPAPSAAFLAADDPWAAKPVPAAAPVQQPAPAPVQQAATPVQQQATPAAAPQMVTLPDGSVVTAEIAALLQQVGS